MLAILLSRVGVPVNPHVTIEGPIMDHRVLTRPSRLIRVSVSAMQRESREIQDGRKVTINDSFVRLLLIDKEI